MSKRVKRGFGVALAAAVLFVAVWLIAANQAGALSPYSKLIDYYDDSTLTYFTGAFCFRECSGAQTCEGTPTLYWVVERDYQCSGSSYRCVKCSTGPCPSYVLTSYGAPECP